MSFLIFYGGSVLDLFEVTQDHTALTAMTTAA
jgi:hypothetical protein